MREKFARFINGYLMRRENLMCLFVLLDSRHGPLVQDMEFMEKLGNNSIPFARIFTKADKLSANALSSNIVLHNKEMMKVWEELPPTFITSSKNAAGRDDILAFIEETLTLYKQ
jgi:GTP-binding protein